MDHRRGRFHAELLSVLLATTLAVDLAGCSDQAQSPSGTSNGGTMGPGSGGTPGAGGGVANGGAVTSGGTNSTAGNSSSGGSAGTNSTAGTTGSGGSQSGGNGVIIDGVCQPLCMFAGSDPDGDGWGWENEASCVVSTSAAAMNRQGCTIPGLGTGGSAAGGSSGSSSGGSSAGTGGSAPIDCSNPGGGSCPPDSSFSCPFGGQVGEECDCTTTQGVGARKCAIVQAGGNLEMLASAMMETGDELDANSYPYGDQLPNGTPKTGDSFNAGVCKQNWGMMRECYGPWNGMGSGSYATSAAINDNLMLDATVYNACRSHFGDDWWAGHRNGAAGLQNPNTEDIQRFKAAWQWTKDRLTGHEADDTYFWVTVPPIN